MAKIEELDIASKKVLVRVDFNVPLNEHFEITDDTRMVRALPTLKYILENGGNLIIASHLGRPQKDLDEEGNIKRDKYSLKHLVPHLTELLEVHVEFVDDCIGENAISICEKLIRGEVVLLENTRFHKGESKGDEDMAESLSKLADIYVNDAFGTAHRAHASTAVVANHFSSDNKAFGFLMRTELENGYRILNEAENPVTAIVGGAKVSDKIQLIEKLMEFADNILIGGGMSYTFLKAQGYEIGKSLVENDYLDLALELLHKAKDNGTHIFLPEDHIFASHFSNDAETEIVVNDKMKADWMGLDIGPLTRDTYSAILLESKSILWNGPVGVFEMEKFASGTLSLAEAIAKSTQNGAYSLIGGGDSVSAVNKAGVADQVSFISTGGGAMLELLEGKILPGVAAILD